MDGGDFELEVSDCFGNIISFASIEHLQTFFEDEQERWQWINEVGFRLADVRGRFAPNLTTIQS